MKILKKIGLIIVILLVLRILSIFFFPWYIVKSDSMEPTIPIGTHLFASRYHYSFFDVQRADIVLFPPNDTFGKGYWIHRVIAIEGDVVEIKNGIVTVNNLPTEFPMINHDKDIQIVVPPGMVYQKGDNLKTIHSLEKVSSIIGKVILKI